MIAIHILTCIICIVSILNCALSHSSCADILSSQASILANGEYTISTTTESSLPVYCAFDYSNNYAWTLIESGTLTAYNNGDLDYALTENAPQNEYSPNSSKSSIYRMSKENQLSIKNNSQYLLSTCEFVIDQTVDYWLINLTSNALEYDIWNDLFSYGCLTSESVNIVGYSCSSDKTVGVSQTYETEHLHIEGDDSTCECSDSLTVSFDDNDYFGDYLFFNTDFGCSKSSSSTTQWWLGSIAGVFYSIINFFIHTLAFRFIACN